MSITFKRPPPTFANTREAAAISTVNSYFVMAGFTTVRFQRPSNTASAVKAARVIRSIKSRYRSQAFLFLAYHFFLTSFVHLDIFIIFFILVSNFMNREQAFPSQLLLDGLRFLLDERRFVMP
jgi:glycosyltransferase involved in cell wall biosynthesis